MKTIQINIYSFSELSAEAKQVAIQDYRSQDHNDVQFAYDDAHQTVKAFNDLFNVKEDSREWNNYSISHWDDIRREMQGTRLHKYLWNNYRKNLYKGKYYGTLTTETAVYHHRIKPHKMSNGKYCNQYYSRITLVHDCVLTGMGYDDCMLSPIYKFLEHPEESKTFEDLISDCFSEIIKTMEKEEEYYNSDEYISETMQYNDYEFTQEGKRY